MPKFLFTQGGPLMDALAAAVGIDTRYVSRMILDLKVGSPGRLYLETFADDVLLKVELPEGFSIAEETTE